MAQIQTTGHRTKQSPNKMLVSTMIEKNDQELEQMIRNEAAENVVLEIVDPHEASASTTEAEPQGDDTYDDPASPEQPDSDDGVLSDEERGEDVVIGQDDETYDDDPAPQPTVAASATEGHDIFATAASKTTDREELKTQLDLLNITDEERFLAGYIIDSLDNDGYLRHPLDELVDELDFTQHHATTEEDLEAVLVEIVQEELEPAGIGARDLRECLLLQAQELSGTPVHRLAYIILDEAFDDLAAKRYDRIQERYGISSHQAWVEVMRSIRHLNPRPCYLQGTTAGEDWQDIVEDRIVPDFFVRNEEGYLTVMLNDQQQLQVTIRPEEQRNLEELQAGIDDKTAPTKATQDRREAARFLRDSIQRGQTFIDCLQQRQQTMLTVMQTIVEMQRAYFLTGQVETLRPMTLEDVEQRCPYDKSTISRVTSSKYADTEFGIVQLKQLFSNAVGDTTQTAIMDALRQIIETEDKQQPFTDDALVSELSKQGYDIARRTVLKYRQHMGYGSARERRQ